MSLQCTDEATQNEGSFENQLGRFSRRPLSMEPLLTLIHFLFIDLSFFIESGEEQDFLCGLADTGALSIWHLRSNSSSPTHTPSVSLSIQLVRIFLTRFGNFL